MPEPAPEHAAHAEVCWAVPLAPPPPQPAGRAGAAPAPAPTVLQVGWHPLSDSHLAVLYADGTFCLYGAADLRRAELTLHVSDGSDGAVAFTFGTAAQRGWASLTTYFACASGRVYTACPLLPRSRRATGYLMAISAELREAAPTDAARQRAAAWIATASKLGGGRGGGGGGGDDDAPALQGGYLVADGAGERQPSARGVGVLSMSALPLVGGHTVLALALSDGSVLISLVTGAVQPAWAGGGGGADGPPIELLLLSQSAPSLPPPANPGAARDGGRRLAWARLVPDPQLPSSLFVHCADGQVLLLEMPWLQPCCDFLDGDGAAENGGGDGAPEAPPRTFEPLGLLPRPGAAGAGAIVGVAVLRDPSLRPSLVYTTSDADDTYGELPLDALLRERQAALAASRAANGGGKSNGAGKAAGGAQLQKLKQYHAAAADGAGEPTVPPAVRQRLAAANVVDEESLEAWEAALDAIGGRGSALADAHALAHATRERLGVIEEMAGAPPGGGGGGGEANELEKLQADARDVAAAVAALKQKASFCAEFQATLDARSRLLSKLLRMPALWPRAPLTADERRAAERLDGMRDAADACRQQLDRLRPRAAAAAAGGGGGGGGGGAADDGALAPLLQRRLDDAENEVRTQAQEVEQLQQLLSEAQRHADAALGAARGVKRG